MLTRLLSLLGLSGASRSTGKSAQSGPNPLLTFLHDHPADVPSRCATQQVTRVPDPTEAECDRYTRYHSDNRWGR